MGGNFEKCSPGITVAGGEAHEAVGQIVVVDERAKLAPEVRRVAHRTIPVANNGLSDESSEVVIVLPADTLNCESNVSSWDSVITNSDVRANEVWLTLLFGGNGGGSRAWWLAGEVSKVLFSKFDELLVRNTTSTNKNHTVSSVVGLDIVDKVFTLNAGNVLLWSKDRSAKRLALESSGVQVIKDDLL